MQHIKVTATPTGTFPRLAYSLKKTDPNPATPHMINGIWEADLPKGTYYFCLIVTVAGGTACTIAIEVGGIAQSSINYTAPFPPGVTEDYAQNWVTVIS